MQEEGTVLFLTLVMILIISMITISLLSIVGKQKITALDYQENLENTYMLKAAGEKAEQKLRENLDENKPWRACDLQEINCCGSLTINSLEKTPFVVNYELKKVVSETGKVNPNFLSSPQLQELPGIGTVLSARIEQRSSNEAFIAIAELKTIKGVGKESYEKFSSLLTINTQGQININTASHYVLRTLPGIGSFTALKIINYRQSKGAFITTEKIKDVAGIGAVTYQKIVDQIVVDSKLFTAVFKVSIPARNIEQEVTRLIKLSDN